MQIVFAGNRADAARDYAADVFPSTDTAKIGPLTAGIFLNSKAPASACEIE